MCYVCMRYENTGAFDYLLLTVVELISVQLPILYTILSNILIIIFGLPQTHSSGKSMNKMNHAKIHFQIYI